MLVKRQIRYLSRRCMSTASPIVELREYQLHAEHATAYVTATAESASIRAKFTPLRFFSLPETGGYLNVATHAYYYSGGHEERNEKRAALETHPAWQDYMVKCRPFVQTQQSNIYVEAPLVQDFAAKTPNVGGLAPVPKQEASPCKDCILELRRYKLKLGYDTVPKFLDLYGQGLPSKLSAEGTDASTSLVTLLYSDVGRLNEVIEVWRHGKGTQAMEQSRVAARKALEWREAIAGIANLAVEFQTTIHKPTSFSPL